MRWLLAPVLVAIAGGGGAVLRYAITAWMRGTPPGALVVVNVAGSLLAGFATTLLLAQPELAMLTVVGFCGGLTTYSAFATETVQLVEQRRIRTAVLSVTATLVGGTAAALVGAAAGFAVRTLAA